MKNTYERAILAVIKIKRADIITTSGETQPPITLPDDDLSDLF